MALMASTLISYGVAGLWQYAFLPVGRRLRLDWRTYRSGVAFSWRLFANNLLGFVFQRADTALVAWLMAPIQVAYFEMGKRVPLLLSRILVAGLVPFLPNISERVARNDLAGASRLLNQTVALFNVLVYTAALGIMLLAKPLITFLFSEKYLPCIPAINFLLLSTALSLQAGITGQTLIALNRPGLVTKVNIGAAVVSVAANVVLIPDFGIQGAAMAAVLTYAFSTALQSWLAFRNGMRLDLRAYVHPHLFMVVSVAIVWTTESAWLQSGAIALFVGLCFATSTITLEHVKKLASAVRP